MSEMIFTSKRVFGCFLTFLFLIVNLACDDSTVNLQQTPMDYEETNIHCINLHGRQDKKDVWIIQSQDELEAMLPSSPFLHPDCSVESLPQINFNTLTLLGLVVTSGGCGSPRVDYTVIRDSQDQITITVNVIPNGFCRALYIKNIWLLIPKQDALLKSDVEVIRTTNN